MKPMKTTRCRQCITGLAAGDTKTFDPRCPGCAEKLASGLRTGKERPPIDFMHHRRPKMERSLFMARVARAKAVKARQRDEWLSMVEPR